MKIELRTVGEIIAVVSVVFSLLFVGYEMRLSRSIAESQQLETNSALMSNLRELISLNSDVWNKGCLGEELTTNERLVFNNIAAAVIDFRWTQYTKAGIGLTPATPDTVAFRTALNRYRYPGFNHAYMEEYEALRGTRYSAEELDNDWHLAVENQYQSLIASGAPSDIHDGWCGR